MLCPHAPDFPLAGSGLVKTVHPVKTTPLPLKALNYAQVTYTALISSLVYPSELFLFLKSLYKGKGFSLQEVYLLTQQKVAYSVVDSSLGYSLQIYTETVKIYVFFSPILSTPRPSYSRMICHFCLKIYRGNAMMLPF